MVLTFCMFKSSFKASDCPEPGKYPRVFFTKETEKDSGALLSLMVFIAASKAIFTLFRPLAILGGVSIIKVPEAPRDNYPSSVPAIDSSNLQGRKIQKLIGIFLIYFGDHHLLTPI